jgi:cold shock protein
MTKSDDRARQEAPVPAEPFGTRRTALGTVKWWRPAKGYGVIACERLRLWDIWCHFSAIDAEGFRNLTDGELVEVEYIRMDRESFKYVALRVRRLGASTTR